MQRNTLIDLIPSTLTYLIIVSGVLSAVGQVATGGSHTIGQAVIANGGGRNAGVAYDNEGTIGQTATGTYATGGSYGLRSGFWNPILAPSAANVSISGRVERSDGAGIGNVRVSLSGGSLTAPRIAITNSFGYFTFDDIEAGQSVVITVTSKRYGFHDQARWYQPLTT